MRGRDCNRPATLNSPHAGQPWPQRRGIPFAPRDARERCRNKITHLVTQICACHWSTDISWDQAVGEPRRQAWRALGSALISLPGMGRRRSATISAATFAGDTRNTNKSKKTKQADIDRGLVSPSRGKPLLTCKRCDEQQGSARLREERRSTHRQSKRADPVAAPNPRTLALSPQHHDRGFSLQELHTVVKQHSLLPRYPIARQQTKASIARGVLAATSRRLCTVEVVKALQEPHNRPGAARLNRAGVVVRG